VTIFSSHLQRAAGAALIILALWPTLPAEAQISIIGTNPGTAAPAPPAPTDPSAPPAGGTDGTALPTKNMIYTIGPNLGDPRLHACRTTEDCAVVNPGCGMRHIAVNSAFAGELQSFYDSAALKGSCRIVVDNQNDVAICNAAHQCGLALPGSNGMPRPDAPLYCNAAADCTVVTDACGRKTAMNLQSAASAPPPGDPAACSYTDTSTVQSLDCVNHSCRLQLQNH